MSRTTGLPVGPEPGDPETVSFIDGFATALEILIVAGGLAILMRSTSELWLRGRAGLTTAVAVSLLVVPATTIAMATAEEHGGHESENAHGDESHENGEEGHENGIDVPEVQTLDLGDQRTLQVIVDSLQPPTYQVHLTFTDGDGTELAIQSASVSATSATGTEFDPETIRLSRGHYVANARLDPGDWEFEVRAVTEDGEVLESTFESHVEEG